MENREENMRVDNGAVNPLKRVNARFQFVDGGLVVQSSVKLAQD